MPPELDESTLNVADGGTYWPGSRALVWEIGELASKAGSIVTFSAQVPSSAISGTIIAADATVYFPSVPETTPTNSVVTIIEDVVAHSQQIETPEDVPADLTLTGSSPRPNPLSFSIIEDPLNGALSGEVAYDSTRNVARFTPSEPLAWDETYTVTVTTAVHDSSGNPMAADYVWSFHTEVGTRVYLPLVLKH